MLILKTAYKHTHEIRILQNLGNVMTFLMSTHNPPNIATEIEDRAQSTQSGIKNKPRYDTHTHIQEEIDEKVHK